MNPRIWRSAAIGLGIPVIGVLIVLPLLANTSATVFGMPLLFAWMFLMFPLTSLCLWIAWRIDEPDYRDDAPAAAADRGERR